MHESPAISSKVLTSKCVKNRMQKFRISKNESTKDYMQGHDTCTRSLESMSQQLRVEQRLGWQLPKESDNDMHGGDTCLPL